MKSGIYIITNTITKMAYIGQAQDVYRRWGSHKTYLRAGTHHNVHLQRSWNEHGQDAFAFSILKECPLADLDAEEQLAIDTYEGELYNSTRDVVSPMRGRTHSSDAVAKMVAYQNRPEVKEARRIFLAATFDPEAARERMSALHADPEFRSALIKRVNSPEWKRKARDHVNSFNKSEKHKSHLKSQALNGGKSNMSVYERITCEECGKTVTGKGNFARWHANGKCKGKN